ncbi:hypothetical protein GCM10027514_15900 [Azotobacter armeniacus]
MVGDSEAVGLQVADPGQAAVAVRVAVHIDGDGLGGLDGSDEGEGEQCEAAHGSLWLGKACGIILPSRPPNPGPDVRYGERMAPLRVFCGLTHRWPNAARSGRRLIL